MKNFLLFYGDDCYPGGGWNDFGGAFESAEIARNELNKIKSWDWFQIVDLTTLTVVKSNLSFGEKHYELTK